MPHLLIACAAWQAADYIDDAIGSALAAPMPAGWTRSTIIGVDGCPDTLTAALRVRDRHPGVAVASFDKTDVYRVRNAIARLGGSWDAMGVVDADDLNLYHRWLVSLPLMSRVSIVTGQSMKVSRKLRATIPPDEMPASWGGVRQWVGVWSFCHPATTIRRDLWDALKGYSNQWPIGCDTHFHERARRRPDYAIERPCLMVLQRVHPTQLTAIHHFDTAFRKQCTREIMADAKIDRDPLIDPAVPIEVYEAR